MAPPSGCQVCPMATPALNNKMHHNSTSKFPSTQQQRSIQASIQLPVVAIIPQTKVERGRELGTETELKGVYINQNQNYFIYAEGKSGCNRAPVNVVETKRM